MLCKETGLSISVDYNYKFLVLIPIEADENLEALKHYYGITQQGELVVRGIEIRRHDIPIFIKQFQTELLYTLFDCKDSAEVVSKGYENCLLLVTKAIDKIMTGEEIQQEDLVISKLLGQEIEKYKIYFLMCPLPFNYSAVKREVITQQKATLSSISTQIQNTTIPFAELYFWRFYKK